MKVVTSVRLEGTDVIVEEHDFEATGCDANQHNYGQLKILDRIVATLYCTKCGQTKDVTPAGFGKPNA